MRKEEKQNHDKTEQYISVQSYEFDEHIPRIQEEEEKSIELYVESNPFQKSGDITETSYQSIQFSENVPGNKPNEGMP